MEGASLFLESMQGKGMEEETVDVDIQRHPRRDRLLT